MHHQFAGLETVLRRMAEYINDSYSYGNDVVDNAKSAGDELTMLEQMISELKQSQASAKHHWVFSCPSCGDPSAQTKELDVDIHAGATYSCSECGKTVIFEALTTAEYCNASRWSAIKEARESG